MQPWKDNPEHWLSEATNRWLLLLKGTWETICCTMQKGASLSTFQQMKVERERKGGAKHVLILMRGRRQLTSAQTVMSASVLHNVSAPIIFSRLQGSQLLPTVILCYVDQIMFIFAITKEMVTWRWWMELLVTCHDYTWNMNLNVYQFSKQIKPYLFSEQVKNSMKYLTF